jgi:hypothetical protein
MYGNIFQDLLFDMMQALFLDYDRGNVSHALFKRRKAEDKKAQNPNTNPNPITQRGGGLDDDIEEEEEDWLEDAERACPGVKDYLTELMIRDTPSFALMPMFGGSAAAMASAMASGIKGAQKPASGAEKKPLGKIGTGASLDAAIKDAEKSFSAYEKPLDKPGPAFAAALKGAKKLASGAKAPKDIIDEAKAFFRSFMPEGDSIAYEKAALEVFKYTRKVKVQLSYLVLLYGSFCNIVYSAKDKAVVITSPTGLSKDAFVKQARYVMRQRMEPSLVWDHKVRITEKLTTCITRYVEDLLQRKEPQPPNFAAHGFIRSAVVKCIEHFSIWISQKDTSKDLLDQLDTLDAITMESLSKVKDAQMRSIRHDLYLENQKTRKMCIAAMIPHLKSRAMMMYCQRLASRVESACMKKVGAAKAAKVIGRLGAIKKSDGNSKTVTAILVSGAIPDSEKMTLGYVLAVSPLVISFFKTLNPPELYRQTSTTLKDMISHAILDKVPPDEDEGHTKSRSLFSAIDQAVKSKLRGMNEKHGKVIDRALHDLKEEDEKVRPESASVASASVNPDPKKP